MVTIFAMLLLFADTPVQPLCELLKDAKSWDGKMVKVAGRFRFDQHMGALIESVEPCDLRGGDPSARWEPVLPLVRDNSALKDRPVSFLSPPRELRFLVDLLLPNIKSTGAFQQEGLMVELHVEVSGELQAPKTYRKCCGPEPVWLGAQDSESFKAQLVYSRIDKIIAVFNRFQPARSKP